MTGPTEAQRRLLLDVRDATAGKSGALLNWRWLHWRSAPTCIANGWLHEGSNDWAGRGYRLTPAGRKALEEAGQTPNVQ